jgi:hypothetical protein
VGHVRGRCGVPPRGRAGPRHESFARAEIGLAKCPRLAFTARVRSSSAERNFTGQPVDARIVLEPLAGVFLFRQAGRKPAPRRNAIASEAQRIHPVTFRPGASVYFRAGFNSSQMPLLPYGAHRLD